MASTANRSPLWAKLNLRKGAVRTPNTINQTANRIIPRLFGSFIVALLVGKQRKVATDDYLLLALWNESAATVYVWSQSHQLESAGFGAG
jgi:hypothetical protein